MVIELPVVYDEVEENTKTLFRIPDNNLVRINENDEYPQKTNLFIGTEEFMYLIDLPYELVRELIIQSDK